MMRIKTAAPLFTFFAVAVIHGGCMDTSPSNEDAAAAAEPVSTAELSAPASSCTAPRIEHIPMKSGSTTLGFLDLYFNSATGDSCATVTASGGAASSIEVCLIRCKETSPGRTCTPDGEVCDGGPHRSFAGPVVLHAPGRCIDAVGELTVNDITVSADATGCS